MVFAGALGGLGGAYFACVYARVWSDELIAGRGWIALALVIFASWRPLALLPGAILFGFLDALNFQLQTQGVGISADWLGMMPYVFTIVALLVLGLRRRRGSAGAPAALGVPYAREARV
jgi:simple sugar transport system permease protein